jgi:hypothetical protein
VAPAANELLPDYLDGQILPVSALFCVGYAPLKLLVHKVLRELHEGLEIGASDVETAELFN